MYKRQMEDTDDEETEITSDDVTVIDNHIYFYCEVSKASALKFNIEFKKLIKRNRLIGIENDIASPPIKIYINSVGGEVMSALSIVETIRKSPIEVWTIVDGEAASAATLISCMGHKRFINKNAIMLIHQLRTGFWGKADEFEEEAKNNKKIMKIIRNIYLDRTSMDKEELDSILKKDSYMISKKCFELGIVDEII
jgi:ATP-dependent Clp endopeptidase proteolytic subunit ClpP